MATLSAIGFGITLGHSTTIGGTYINVAEILDITPATGQVDEVKIYRSDNTTATVEKIPGWIENSDAELTITYTPSNRSTLDVLQGTPLFWKITYPKVGSQATTGDTEAFHGFIKSFGKETPLKDAMKMKIKFAVDGAITFTAGS
jgi:hypothetical protein